MSSLTATHLDLFKTSEHETNLYAFPAENVLYIDDNIQTGKAMATIYTITGMEVMNTAIQPSKSIDISSLSAGQYIISISSGENISHQRFLKK